MPDEEIIEVAADETVAETGLMVEGGAEIILKGTEDEIAASMETLDALAEDPQEPID